jgi:hypothetical protein
VPASCTAPKGSPTTACLYWPQLHSASELHGTKGIARTRLHVQLDSVTSLITHWFRILVKLWPWLLFLSHGLRGGCHGVTRLDRQPLSCCRCVAEWVRSGGGRGGAECEGSGKWSQCGFSPSRSQSGRNERAVDDQRTTHNATRSLHEERLGHTQRQAACTSLETVVKLIQLADALPLHTVVDDMHRAQGKAHKPMHVDRCERYPLISTCLRETQPTLCASFPTAHPGLGCAHWYVWSSTQSAIEHPFFSDDVTVIVRL